MVHKPCSQGVLQKLLALSNVLANLGEGTEMHRAAEVTVERSPKCTDGLRELRILGMGPLCEISSLNLAPWLENRHAIIQPTLMNYAETDPHGQAFVWTDISGSQRSAIAGSFLIPPTSPSN